MIIESIPTNETLIAKDKIDDINDVATWPEVIASCWVSHTEMVYKMLKLYILRLVFVDKERVVEIVCGMNVKIFFFRNHTF